MQHVTADALASSPGLAEADAHRFRTEIQEFKRTRILEVALDLFFKKGYEQTTLSSISRRLGVTRPFIYNYFQNKGEILGAICEIGIRRCMMALEEARTVDLPPPEALRRAIANVMSVVMENHAAIVLFDREKKNLNKSAAIELLRLRQQFDLGLVALLKDGVVSGDFQLDDPELTAGTIGGIFSWVAGSLRPESALSAETMSHVVRLVERMVLRDGQ